MTKCYSVKTPGKLYISGEYAILEPGQLALVKNIPIYMTAKISQNQTFQIQSDLFNYSVGRELDNNYSLIQDTITYFETYLERPLSPFRLDITGKLEEHGKKYGIGSSGSVVILTLKALARFEDVSLSKDTLFKLACLILLGRGDNGSMGDLACIAYDDFVAYTSFDRLEIKRQLDEKGLKEVLLSDWGYTISVVKVALPSIFMVGWTQEPAISKDLVNDVKSAITNPFLHSSHQLSLDLKQSLEKGDMLAVKRIFGQLSNLLFDLHTSIKTSRLERLIEISSEHGAVAKSSGAGGGDCGIALAFDQKAVDNISALWKEEGIKLLYQENWGNYES